MYFERISSKINGIIWECIKIILTNLINKLKWMVRRMGNSIDYKVATQMIE